MPKPVRVQLSRRKGFNLQAASPNGLPVVNVARPSKWGNPYTLDTYDIRDVGDVPMKAGPERDAIAREMAVRDHDAWLHCFPSGEAIAAAARVELRGKNLACFCKLDAECHADALLAVANGDA